MKSQFTRTKGYSITEILVVTILLTMTAGFALPQYTKSVRKNRERTALSMLRNIQSGALIYRSKNGAFWNTTGTWETTEATIETNLDITLVDPSGLIGYEYRSVGGTPPTSYEARADWTEGGVRTVLEIRETTGRDVTGPCCNGGLSTGDACLSVPDC